MNSNVNILITTQAAQARSAIASVQAQLRALAATSTTSAAASNRPWYTGLTTARGQIASTQAQLRGLTTATTTANAASNRPWFASMTASGSRLQWIGRQLTSNFTAPVLIAAGAGVKFGLDMEKSMTRLKKVYGDGTMSAKTMANETKALENNFIALSERFGVQADEVAMVGAEWAAAGASGAALARGVELTMRTMVLGEMEATEATQALIAIQAQWGYSTEQLGTTLTQLNAVENETGTTMNDLVVAFSRASGVAKSVGMDTGHLAAMVSALVPAAGSASEAGTSLRTMLNRLFTPTKQSGEVLTAMGINLSDTAWQSMNASQRMEELAGRFEDLTAPQKQVVSSLVASRWQINKFEVLMDSLNNKMGYYHKSLRTLADTNRVAAIAEAELNTVLASNPQRAKQAGVIIQNSLMKAMEPLIPVIIQVALWFGKLFKAFSSITPSTRSLIIVIILLLSALGPLIIMAGILKLSIGQLAPIFKFFGRMLLLPLAPLKLLRLSFWATATQTVVGSRLMALAAVLMKTVSIAIKGVAIVTIAAWQLMVAGTKAGYAAMVAASRTGNLMLIASQTAWSALSLAVQSVWRAASVLGFALWSAATLVIQRQWSVAWLTITFAWSAASQMLMTTWSAATRGIMLLMMSAGSTIMLAGHTAWLAIQRAYSAAMILLANITMGGMLAAFRRGWALIVGLATGGMRGIFSAILRGGAMIIGALSSPWLIAIGIVVGLIVIFRKQIAQAWQNILNYFRNIPAEVSEGLSPLTNIFVRIKNFIVRAWNALPDGIRNALLKVVAIVRAAALKIYELFSYINPFAHHSPSLVENVTNGMAAVNAQFANSAKVAKNNINSIHKSIKSLEGLGSGVKASNEAADYDTVKSNAAKAGAGNAMPAYDKLNADVARAKKQMDSLNKSIEAQEAKLKGIQAGVAAYDAALEKLNSELEVTKSIQESVGAALDGAKARYERFANAQVRGLGAAEDAAFDNEQAQKRLQLQIAKMEQESGVVDGVSDSYSKLQGTIEELTAKQTELRKAGAGSDILGTYDKMIDDLKSQQGAILDGGTDSPAGKIAALNTQLEKLKAQAEMMDLEKSLKFDSLNRNIEKFKNNVEELPYGQIMSGMDASRTSVNALQMSYDQLGYVMDGQNARIAQTQASRDALQKVYDAENAKLDSVKETYNSVEESVRSGEQALSDFASAAETAVQRQEEAARAAEETAKKLEDKKKKDKNGKGGGGGEGELSPGMQNFQDAAAGDFANFGGDAVIGREGGLGDQTADIDALTAGITGDIEKSLGGLNPFEPLKEWWNKTVDWFKNISAPLGDFFGGIGSGISSAFSSEKNGEVSAFGDTFRTIGDTVKSFWDILKQVGGFLWDLFGEDLLTTIKELGGGFADIWGKIIGPLQELGGTILPFLKTVFIALTPTIVAFIAALEIIWEVINGAIGPVFSWLGDIIAAVIKIIMGIVKVITGALKVIQGIIQMFIGLIKGIFTGDFSMFTDGFKKVASGIADIFGGIWDIIKGIWQAILSTIVNFAKLIWNTVWGFIKGVIDFFTHLWDVLVGHSIVPDMIKAIIQWFLSLPGKILSGLWTFIKAVIGFFLKLPGMILGALASLGKFIWNAFSAAFTWLVTNGPALLLGLMNFIISLPLKIIGWLGDIGAQLFTWLWNGFLWLVTNAPGLLLELSVWLISLPGKIIGWLGDIGGKLAGWMKAGWDWLVGAIPGMLTALWEWVKNFPSNFVRGLGIIGGKLGEWLRAGWDWLVDNMPTLIAKLWDWIKSFPSNFVRGLGVIGSKLGEWIKAGWNWIVDNGPSILAKLWDWVKGIPGKILDKLGDAGKMLWDFGKNMIQGLINGAGSLLKKIGEFFLDLVPGWIKGPFKKAMGIASPSKVFKSYGTNLGEGLIQGIDGMQGKIEASSIAMAAAADKGDVGGMSISAAADTSSVGGAVSQLSAAASSATSGGAAIGVAATVEPTTDPGDIDYAAAEAELDAFIASSTAKLTVFSATVSKIINTMVMSVTTAVTNMSLSAGTAFTNMNLVATTQFTSMQQTVVMIVTNMVAAVAAQLQLLVNNVTLFGQSFTAAWLAAWQAWQETTTNGVNHTLSEWERMALGLTNTLETGIRPVFNEMEAMLLSLEEAYARTVDNVGQTWDGIKEKTAAPARFVINDVYNDGIRGAWNKFNKFLDLDELPEHTANFREGGSVRGAGTGTSDSIRAMLSNGEHVVTAREVRAAGGHAAIENQRAAWLAGRSGAVGSGPYEAFKDGGPVGDDGPGFVSGGTVNLGNISGEGITTPIQQAMWDAVRTAFPQVQLNSATRSVQTEGHADYHNMGMAIDVSPSPQIANWIYEMNKTQPVLELIHWPLAGWQNLKNGAPLDYGAATNSGHMDHVHWAMNTMVDNEGKVVSMGPMGTPMKVDYGKMVRDEIKSQMDRIADKDPKLGGGIGQWPPKSIEWARTHLNDFLGPKADKLTTQYSSGNQGNIPYDLSAGVEQWRKLATEMLIMQGESATYVDRLLMQMQSESGGNPNAINLWDSNAAAGHPSKGLMQVIDPTFQANRDPRLPNNVWDPAANIAASIRYTRSNYGSLDRWNGTGYDAGGVLPPGFTLAHNQTGGPEAILTSAQWSAMFEIAKNGNLKPEDVQDAVEQANINTGNTADEQADAIIKGMDVWQKAWTPAVYDATDASTAASEAVVKSSDGVSGATVMLSKSLGKYDEQIKALGKAMVAFSNSAQSSLKVTVNVKTGQTTTENTNSSVTKNEKGETEITVAQPTFAAWAPTINAFADLLDAMPYAERDWAADNPVPGETEKERKARIARNDLTNYAKGSWNVLKDMGPVMMRHTAIIGTAAEQLMTEDGPAWTAAATMMATGNPGGYALATLLALKAVATILPLVLAAILDIVPALIRAIVRFLTQFMPDSVYAYADMASAEAAAQEQYEGGPTAQGQGQRYPTDAMRNESGNDSINLYMYGDLVMPNVSDGSDANDFIDQLKLLASN